VKVADKYHFKYADGKPYKQIGTTAYAWIHQEDSLEEITLETLKNSLSFFLSHFCWLYIFQGLLSFGQFGSILK
jgi:hypothetical protein